MNKIAYIVETNTDLTEGRGKTVILGYFANKATAIRRAKGKGVMGTNAYVRQVSLTPPPDRDVIWCSSYGPVIVEPPSKEDLEEQSKMDEKQRVIDKALQLGITTEELTALGV